MRELQQFKEALLKSAATIRKQNDRIETLEQDLSKKSVDFNSPDKIRETLIKSAQVIRDLKEKVSDVSDLEKKVEEYELFKKALDITNELAKKGAVPWEDLLEKASSLRDSDRIDSIKDSLKYVGAPIDALFSGELSKKSSAGELADGKASAEELFDWIMS